MICILAGHLGHALEDVVERGDGYGVLCIGGGVVGWDVECGGFG